MEKKDEVTFQNIELAFTYMCVMCMHDHCVLAWTDQLPYTATSQNLELYEW
jgi:hypothetical protein